MGSLCFEKVSYCRLQALSLQRTINHLYTFDLHFINETFIVYSILKGFYLSFISSSAVVSKSVQCLGGLSRLQYHPREF